ncbi:MAG: hypothetical protein K1X29_08705 [Bdellovibrionales bacterium]|nr:hypothetical protein [Bdellovibrionales bacterium]
MAKDNKAGTNPNSKPTAEVATVCPVEKCGKKATRMEFCDEHFNWFKEGMISRKGEKPKDFDKKYQAYLSRQKKAS